MKRYGSFGGTRGILFDIDGTLYDSPAYLASHRQVLVERLAMELGRSYDEMRGDVRRTQERIASAAGRRASLAHTFLEYGVSMQQNIAWRNRLLKPERYICADPELRRTLELLSGTFALGAITNNPGEIARRTLASLGVDDAVFAGIVALDDTYASKPERAPFEAGLSLLGLPAAEVVMVGDRYEVDIAPALDVGMAGVLVEGVADVYALPRFLSQAG